MRLGTSSRCRISERYCCSAVSELIQSEKSTIGRYNTCYCYVCCNDINLFYLYLLLLYIYVCFIAGFINLLLFSHSRHLSTNINLLTLKWKRFNVLHLYETILHNVQYTCYLPTFFNYTPKSSKRLDAKETFNIYLIKRCACKNTFFHKHLQFNDSRCRLM